MIQKLWGITPTFVMENDTRMGYEWTGCCSSDAPSSLSPESSPSYSLSSSIDWTSEMENIMRILDCIVSMSETYPFHEHDLLFVAKLASERDFVLPKRIHNLEQCQKQEGKKRQKKTDLPYPFSLEVFQEFRIRAVCGCFLLILNLFRELLR
jgi:hypothetical protein